MELPAWLDPAISIVYIIVLLIGLFFCLKQRRMVEFTFVLFFLFARLINIYFMRYTRLMEDGEIPMPENIDIDKMLAVIEQATQLIEVLAFVILIIGLYKRYQRVQRI